MPTRAIGSPAGLLVRSLLVQVVLVVASGALLATLLFWVLSRGDLGSISVPFDLGVVAFTFVVVLVLALLTALAAVRRVLRIDPIAATTGAGVHI